MANRNYNATGNPLFGSPGTSLVVKNEFAAISTGIGGLETEITTVQNNLNQAVFSTILPDMTGNAGKSIFTDGTNAYWAAGTTQTVYIPAAAITTRITTGAAHNVIEMGTNKNQFRTLDFDPATQWHGQFFLQMPNSWDAGTVTAQFVWSHATTTTNFGIAFGLQGVSLADGDAGDVAFGTGQVSVDTGGTANDIYITPVTSAITISGTPAAGEFVMFQVYREVGNAGDTMAVNARLHGIKLTYGINYIID
jgi:hypothetical protein